jgi:hypothetical protein
LSLLVLLLLVVVEVVVGGGAQPSLTLPFHEDGLLATLLVAVVPVRRYSPSVTCSKPPLLVRYKE